MGDYEVSRTLFPRGLEGAAKVIRQAGMTPGLWFEPEAVGYTASAFACTEHQLHRRGTVLTTPTRRFWDMQDPWVRNHLRKRVIEALRQGNFGYIKLDYNDTIGPGCDGAESPGEGLRRQMEAVGDFWAELRRELSGLLIENCASGGHRLDPGLCLTRQAAAVLGKTKEEQQWGKQADSLLAEIRREYFTTTGRCAVATQTGLALAIAWDLTPDPARTARELQAKLKASGGQLRTGFVGTPLLCAALTRAGLVDQAFDLILNEECPGWLYAVTMGATTVWERWDSVGPDGKIAENGMNSLNHYAYGAVLAWLWQDVAGLAPAAPGFKSARLAPHVHPALGRAHAVYQSASGRWECGWQILENGDVSYRCVVPDGCTAHLELPHGGGGFDLGPGPFAVTYAPDTPLVGRFGLDSTLEQLLDNPRARAVLLRAMPRAGQIPPRMRSMTLRAMAAAMGGGRGLEELGKALAAL